MKFTQQQLKDLMQGKKVQVRYPVKEDEELAFQDVAVVDYREDKGKIKYQVGKDYAVGRPGLWYCPKCNCLLKIREVFLRKSKGRKTEELSCNCTRTRSHPTQRTSKFTYKYFRKMGWQPLRYKITDLRKDSIDPAEWVLTGVKK